MQTKTYFATSVPAALEVARKELGVDAMLVNSRPAPAEVRALGRLEVTFAYDPKPETPADLGRLFPGAPGLRVPAPPPAAPTRDGTNAFAGFNFAALSAPASVKRSEMDELREQIAALRSEILQPGPTTDRPAPATPVFAEYFSAASLALDGRALDERSLDEHSGEHNIMAQRLSRSGLDASTAREIAMAAAANPGERQTALLRELTSRIRTKSFGAMSAGECRTLALIGPPGRGKTTTLIKIAMQYGIAKRIPVKIYSTGTHGIGCEEQMMRYATLLGVPFHAFEMPESLHLALSGDPWKGLVLIDTPGISPSEPEEMTGLARLLSRHPEIEKHVVLRADSGSADMTAAAARFSALAPSALLFTGLDEAVGPGAMVETLIRSRLPAVFVGTGPQIPEDLEEVNASKLALQICGGSRLAVSAAA